MKYEKIYAIWLAEKKLGFQMVRRLLENFGGFEEIYKTRDYKGLVGNSTNEERQLKDKGLDGAQRIMESILRQGAGVLTVLDREYPRNLRMISNPPVVLYTKGIIEDFNSLFCIGMVGTRTSSAYGRKAAEYIAGGLAKEGICVVSGLARGIDSCASAGALAQGGMTLGILGCGIDVVYPSENVRLYEAVEHAGALITEYPPGSAPYGYHFPQRNRIIAGLCAGIVIVEAPEKSGALITAECAANLSRAVFAVPGSVFEHSFSGSHQLLRDGAQIAVDASDITGYFKRDLKLFRLEQKISGSGITHQRQIVPELPQKKIAEQEGRVPDFLNEEEKSIIKILMREKMHIDDIVRKTGRNPGEVSAALFSLELSGLVRRLPGDFYEYICQS